MKLQFGFPYSRKFGTRSCITKEDGSILGDMDVIHNLDGTFDVRIVCTTVVKELKGYSDRLEAARAGRAWCKQAL